MRHKVHIRVRKQNLPEVEVLSSRSRRISARICRMLFGDYSEVLILQPGKTVDGVEIREMPQEVVNGQD